MRRILFNNTYNVRDLGDIPITLSLATKTHKFIRSDALLDLDQSEIKYLQDYGVKVVIDLRNEDEITRHPNILKNNSDFIYINLPFLNSTKMEHKGDYSGSDLKQKQLIDIYYDIVDNHQEEIRKFFELIIEYLQYGILYHCSAGKDRTGILTALLLSIAGVNRLDIIADYEISYTYLIPRLEKLQQRIKDLPMHIMVSKRENLIDLLNYIDKNYQSIHHYLLTIGLSEKQISTIKDLIC